MFAGGFVFFGVGTGNSGLGDIFSEGGFFRGGGTSISKLQKEVTKHPENAEAYRKLANALRGKERFEEAIAPLERYTQLRPKDSGALQELASLYLIRAQRYYDELGVVSHQRASLLFAVSPSSFLAQERQKDPFYKELLAEISSRESDLSSKLQADLSSRADAYKRAVAALPANDNGLPSLVFAWARAAELAQDYQTALKAYQRYLKLAPESALVRDARAAIKRLKILVRSQNSAVTASGGG